MAKLYSYMLFLFTIVYVMLALGMTIEKKTWNFFHVCLVILYIFLYGLS